MTQPALRACPTCATPVSAAKLGMRDYSHWLDGVLPGKVSGSDVDFILDQASTGRVLAIEFKEGNKRLGVGQRLLFKQLLSRGIEVWVAWEYQDANGETEHVLAGQFTDSGEVTFMEKLTPAQFASKVKAWWYSGLEGRVQ
jgi:hypothetical protein